MYFCAYLTLCQLYFNYILTPMKDVTLGKLVNVHNPKYQLVLISLRKVHENEKEVTMLLLFFFFSILS